jgi:RHS repeat-associated protein
LYAYDEAGHLAGEYTAAGALVQETVWLGDTPVATLRPDGSGGIVLYYVHADHLNTPRLVTDLSNNVRWRWDSDAFGTTVPNENPSSLGLFEYNLRFPGQQYDAVVGLHYNYLRDYDPAVGRYEQSDPIGLEGGTNTYAYVEGDPVSFSDATGEYAQLGLWAYRSYQAYRASRAAQAAAAATRSGAAAAAAAAAATSSSQSDSPEKQAERRAYHRRCDEKPPGLTGCDLIRWQIQKVKDCIRMRSDYMKRWNDTYKGHYDQIDQKRRELERLERDLQAGCCG